MQEDWKNWKNDNTRRLYTIYGDLLNTHAWSQTQRYPIGKDRSIFSRMLTFAVKELADKYESDETYKELDKKLRREAKKSEEKRKHKSKRNKKDE